MVNLALNFFSNSSFWFYFIYIIVCIIVLVPLVVGIPMCLKNKTLTSNQKGIWIILLIAFGIVAFIIYCIFSKSNNKLQQ